MGSFNAILTPPPTRSLGLSHPHQPSLTSYRRMGTLAQTRGLTPQVAHPAPDRTPTLQSPGLHSMPSWSAQPPQLFSFSLYIPWAQGPWKGAPPGLSSWVPR